MRKVIRAFVPRGLIPGVGGDDDGLVAGRDAPAVQAERRHAGRRAGARSGSQRYEDDRLRAAGVPVFDRRAGQSELSGYIGRARDRGK